MPPGGIFAKSIRHLGSISDLIEGISTAFPPADGSLSGLLLCFLFGYKLSNKLFFDQLDFFRQLMYELFVIHTDNHHFINKMLEITYLG